MRSACPTGRVRCWTAATHTTAHQKAIRSTIQAQTAIVNSATLVFSRKSLVLAFWPNTSSDRIWPRHTDAQRVSVGPCPLLDGCDSHYAFLQLAQRTVEACEIVTILGQNVMGLQSTLQSTLPKRWKTTDF